jgi:hypothetical protein
MARPSMIRSIAERLRGFAACALVLFGLGSADAKSIAPEQAPAAWIAYAEAATQAITGWLNADDPPAPRLRAALDATRPAADRPVPPLKVSLWIAQDGTLTRIEAAPLGSPRADQDLRDLLVGRHLPVPPKRMRQPMRLALQLSPPPERAPETASRASNSAL